MGRVTVSDDLDRVTLPVAEENIETYSTSPDGFLLKGETKSRRIVQEELGSGPRIWKASEILGDEAVLIGLIGYGYVNDLIFTSDARLHAIVVNSYAGYRGGYRAFPFYGYPYGWAPSYPVYHLGYGRDDVVNLRVLDYDKIRRASPERVKSERAGRDRRYDWLGSSAAKPIGRRQEGPVGRQEQVVSDRCLR